MYFHSACSAMLEINILQQCPTFMADLHLIYLSMLFAGNSFYQGEGVEGGGREGRGLEGR